MQALLALAAVALAADPPPPPPPPKPWVVALTVSPAAAPVPALKYELLPRLRDRQPGNAAIEYARAFLLRPAPPKDAKQAQAQQDKVDGWLAAPLDTLPAAELKGYLSGYAATLRAADAAAMLERYDFQHLARLRAEGFAMILPEAQQHRELMWLLKLRARVELAEGRFADAHRTLQTGLRMAKDVGEGPTLIQMLVGIAVASVNLGEVDQWVQRPGSPNLYWALAALPRPLVDPRPGLEGEAVFFAAALPNLGEFEKGPLAAARANELLAGMLDNLGKMTGDTRPEPGPLDGWASAAGRLAYVATQFAASKQALLDEGMPAAEVAKMPPAQVVVLRSVRRVRALSDDQFKCFYLPYPRGRAELARIDAGLKAARGEAAGDVVFNVAGLLMPAMAKVHESHGRLERKVAALRAVEAVRLHLAANGGVPPKSLADITAVPVPEDPNTGKPFEYAATPTGFTLTGPPPEGETPGANNAIRYELTVRK